jgi:hypothetical protein
MPYAAHAAFIVRRTHITRPRTTAPQARNPVGGQLATVSEAWGTERTKLSAREQYPGNDRWLQPYRCPTLLHALGDEALGYRPRRRSSVFDVEVAVPGVGSSGWLLERAQAEQWPVREGSCLGVARLHPLVQYLVYVSPEGVLNAFGRRLASDALNTMPVGVTRTALHIRVHLHF